MVALINKFYVYTHRRASDGVIFYVGKGQTNRAYRKDGRNQHWRNIVAKYGYTIVIEKANLSDGEAATYEIELIASIGRENLCNKTDGGDGMSGYIHTDEGKRKISEAHKGKPRPVESVEKMRAAKRGKKLSEETKRKMSEARKGRKHSDEAIAKMRQKALIRHPDTIAKQVAANTGQKRSAVARANMANSQKGIAVECSNGMRFEKITHAAEWLRKNGHPKASVQSITKAASASHRIAYGLSWRIREGCARPTPTL